MTKLQVLDQLPDMQCPMCLGLLEAPLTLPHGNFSYCNACITTWQQSRSGSKALRGNPARAASKNSMITGGLHGLVELQELGEDDSSAMSSQRLTAPQHKLQLAAHVQHAESASAGSKDELHSWGPPLVLHLNQHQVEPHQAPVHKHPYQPAQQGQLKQQQEGKAKAWVPVQVRKRQPKQTDVIHLGSDHSGSSAGWASSTGELTLPYDITRERERRARERYEERQRQRRLMQHQQAQEAQQEEERQQAQRQQMERAAWAQPPPSHSQLRQHSGSSGSMQREAEAAIIALVADLRQPAGEWQVLQAMRRLYRCLRQQGGDPWLVARKHALCEAGGPAVLVSLLCSQQSGRVLCAAAELLERSCSHHERSRQAAVDAGALAALLRLTGPAVPPDVQAAALDALRALGWRGWQALRLSAVKLGSSSRAVQLEAAQLLITQLEGVDCREFVSSLPEHVLDSATHGLVRMLRREAVWDLTVAALPAMVLARADGGFRQRLLAAGAVPVVLRALQQAVVRQEAVMGAVGRDIRGLVNESRAFTMCEEEDVAHSLRQMGDQVDEDIDVQCAAGLLAALCVGGAGRVVREAAAAAIPYLVVAWVGGVSAAGEAAAAVMEGHARNREQVVKALRELSSSPDRALGHAARRCLALCT